MSFDQGQAACDPSLQTLNEIINSISEQINDAYDRALRIDEIILDRPKGDPSEQVAPPANGINQRLCDLLERATRLNQANALIQSYLV
jgi:hypothetical protein